MLRKYVEQILNLYNYIDGILVVDAKGIIEYFVTYRPDVNNLKEKDLIGRHVLEIYPNLTEESSSLLRVLKKQASLFPMNIRPCLRIMARVLMPATPPCLSKTVTESSELWMSLGIWTRPMNDRTSPLS